MRLAQIQQAKMEGPIPDDPDTSTEQTEDGTEFLPVDE